MGDEDPAVMCENGHALGADDRFCRECGAPPVETQAALEETQDGPLLCTNGHEVEDGKTLCTVCGAPADRISRSPRDASATAGDRLGSRIGARSRRSKLLAGVGAGALFLVIVIAATSCGGSGGSGAAVGFNDPATLASVVRKTGNQQLSDPSSAYYQPGVTMTKVTCVKAGGHIFNCSEFGSNGVNQSTEVTVSADGKTWVLKNT